MLTWANGSFVGPPVGRPVSSLGSGNAAGGTGAHWAVQGLGKLSLLLTPTVLPLGENDEATEEGHGFYGTFYSPGQVLLKSCVNPGS